MWSNDNFFQRFKILGSNYLTLCRTTNFRFFKLEKFAPNNFKFDEKSQKFSRSVETITRKFSFSYCVFKRLLLQTLKTMGFSGIELNFWIGWIQVKLKTKYITRGSSKVLPRSLWRSSRDTPSINLTSAATPLNHRYALIDLRHSLVLS